MYVEWTRLLLNWTFLGKWSLRMNSKDYRKYCVIIQWDRSIVVMYSRSLFSVDSNNGHFELSWNRFFIEKCTKSSQSIDIQSSKMIFSLIEFPNYSIKSLTTLNLYHNRIGDQGAYDFANALQYNTVLEDFSIDRFEMHSCLDTCSFRSFIESNQFAWSWTSSQEFTKE